MVDGFSHLWKVVWEVIAEGSKGFAADGEVMGGASLIKMLEREKQQQTAT